MEIKRPEQFSGDSLRATGRTTRMADYYIQELFKTGRIVIEDHHKTEDGETHTSANRYLFQIIWNRLKLEHEGLIKSEAIRADFAPVKPIIHYKKTKFVVKLGGGMWLSSDNDVTVWATKGIELDTVREAEEKIRIFSACNKQLELKYCQILEVDKYGKLI